jgi:hypothetical protein
MTAAAGGLAAQVRWRGGNETTECVLARVPSVLGASVLRGKARLAEEQGRSQSAMDTPASAISATIAAILPLLFRILLATIPVL